MSDEDNSKNKSEPLSPIVKVGVFCGIGILVLTIFASWDSITSNVSLLLQHPDSITESLQQAGVDHYESEIEPLTNPIGLLATVWILFLISLPFIILGLLSKLGISLFKKKNLLSKIVAIIVMLAILLVIISFLLTISATKF